VDNRQVPPEAGAVRAAVISTDSAFRDQVRAFLSEPGSPAELACVIDKPFTEIADPELAQIRRSEPGLAIVDLESDPHVGLKFVQFLVESGLVGSVMAAGRDLTSDLLLRAVQAGVMEILQKPASTDELKAALERVWKKTGRIVAAAPRSGPGHAVALFAAKGGMGTTSIATNLAIEIHRLTRARTLLLDLDLELGETALLLGMDPQFSLVDLIRNLHRVDQGLLASYIERHESGIDLLAAPFQPADYETVSRDRVRQVVSFLKEQYDYIVMDTPKSFHPASIGVLEEADETLLVTSATLPAIRNLSRSLPLVRQLATSRGRPPLRLVVNRYVAGELISLPEIADAVGVEVFQTIHNDFQGLLQSVNEGKPLVLSRSGSPFAKDVRTLAAKITGVAAGEAPRRRGLLGGLVGSLRNGKGK
jgi:pilus assembly protein CpaE